MTETPASTDPTSAAPENAEAANTADTAEAAIPAQQDGGSAAVETPDEETTEDSVATEPVAEAGEDKAEDKSEDKSKSKRPKKSAPRKAAGTKALVVLRDGRVQWADADVVLVIDLDDAAAPDTDVHDVVDRLAELRDAVECPGKGTAVKALTELIQEKALG